MSFEDLCRVAHRYAPISEDAEDIAQEAAIRLWRNGDVEASHAARVVRTIAIDLWRHKYAVKRTMSLTSPGNAPSAEREALARLSLAEACLTHPYVVALEAGYLVREIADKEHLPEGTVKTKIRRARQALAAA